MPPQEKGRGDGRDLTQSGSFYTCREEMPRRFHGGGEGGVLLYRHCQQFRAGDDVIERRGGGFVD